MNNISLEDVGNFALPLPPLAEQHRIVAKVDELMVLCDQLEAVREERERRRDRLAAVSLNQIGKPTEVEEVFREHARFHLANLSNFTTRPDQIHVLRKMILDLAVKGKLVSQNSNDEPASVLLNRIQSDKLGKDITKSLKPLLSTSIDKGLPYKSPKGWEWVCLQDIFCSITDGDHLPPLKTENGVPFLVIGNVRKGVVDFSGCRHVSESYYSELASIRRPQKGDILYTLVGSYGIPVLLVDDRPFCVQRHIGILRPSIRIDTKFLARVLASGLVYEQATNCATGIAQKTVPLAGLRKIRIPLPPLAEQHRIVAKVDELIALCDRLEVQLTSVQTESHRLLEALLHQVMEPALEEVSA